jgi:hypothetical protein
LGINSESLLLTVKRAMGQTQNNTIHPLKSYFPTGGVDIRFDAD